MSGVETYVDRSAALEIACVTEVEVSEWYAAGWLSEEVAKCRRYREQELAQLVFIRDIVRSGLDRARIQVMLSDLPRPYAYESARVAYSFRYGWVQTAAESLQASVFLDDKIAWLHNLDPEELPEIFDEICSILNGIDDEDDED